MGEFELSTLIRKCCCSHEEADEEKTFCYIEGSKLDKTILEEREELSENVWLNLKPPKLFEGHDQHHSPRITARQIQIKRIELEGKRKLAGQDEGSGISQKVNISINKKKTAVNYLSNTDLDEWLN